MVLCAALAGFITNGLISQPRPVTVEERFYLFRENAALKIEEAWRVGYLAEARLIAEIRPDAMGDGLPQGTVRYWSPKLIFQTGVMMQQGRPGGLTSEELNQFVDFVELRRKQLAARTGIDTGRLSPTLPAGVWTVERYMQADLDTLLSRAIRFGSEVLAWIAGFVALLAGYRLWWLTRPSEGSCRRCGYSREGLGTEVCPECGDTEDE